MIGSSVVDEERESHPIFQDAGRAGIGATLGLVLGVAAKLALGFAMLGVFLVARFV